MIDDSRPNPDALLAAIKKESERENSGQLRIFFGMAAGVGKTYAMLEAAHERLAEGVDVVIGVVETHSRAETEALVKGLDVIPRKKITYKETNLEELDLDTIILRKPQIVLVDELAHTNVPGSRHEKRWQDVIEILSHGIDVYTTLNVQHLESRKDAVEQIAGITIRETVPDSILDRANEIKLVDTSPHELLKRLQEGKVYLAEKIQAAQGNFFKKGQLTALREIALRYTAERVDQELQDFMVAKQIQGPFKTSERLMVAVSHSPHSARLIRATRRIAASLECPWIAINIETGGKLNEEDEATLAKNITLARELGGEIVTTTDPNIPAALQRVAKEKNVTQIIVGRPVKRLFRDILEGGTILDQLVRESGHVDVHVIREDTPPRRPVFFSRLQFDATLTDYSSIVWFVIGLSGLAAILNPLIGYKAVGFLFLLGVLFAGIRMSLGPILFVATSSSLIWDYFFIPPQFTFTVTESEDVAMLITFCFVAILTGFFTTRIKRHERLHREREDRTQLLYEIASIIATSEDFKKTIYKINEKLGLPLEGQSAVILKGKDGKLEKSVTSFYSFPAGEKEHSVANWAFTNNKKAGWATDTLPDSNCLYIPLSALRETVGVWAFKPNTKRKFSIETENFVFNVARQIAIFIERHFLEERTRETIVLRESEKLHQTLLSSISHELRTPLTTIVGTASALAEKGDPKQKELIQELMASTERLNRVIENLLDMTRLSSGVLKLNLDWHDLNDLVHTTIQRIRPLLKGHKILLQLPHDSPLARIDFRLMEHVLSNLVINAADYSPQESNITIDIKVHPQSVMVSVLDEGPGIPTEHLDKIFDKFFRVPGTSTGGTGLGLSIAKNIVELHNGILTVQDLEPKGASFVITLPLEKVPEVPREKTS